MAGLSTSAIRDTTMVAATGRREQLELRYRAGALPEQNGRPPDPRRSSCRGPRRTRPCMRGCSLCYCQLSHRNRRRASITFDFPAQTDRRVGASA